MIESTVEAPEPTAGVEETQPTAEAPAAPEGASPPDSGAEPDPAGKAPSQSTRPRDAHGRFIKADGTVATDAEQAALEKSDAAPPVSPAPTSPPVAAVPAGEPFVVRGDGQRLTMPGSTLNAQGDLLVKAEHIPTYRQLIAEGLAHRGSWRQRETEYKQQIETAGAAAEARVAKYNEASVYLFDLISDPAKLTALVESPERIQMVKERLALMLERHDLNIPKTAAAPTAQAPEANDAAIETAARATLDGYLEELLESPQAKAVYDTPDKRQALSKRFQRRLNAYFVEREDGVALHENMVDEDFKEELQERIEARKLATQSAKAAEFNATRKPAPPAAPPVVSTKGSGSTGAAPRKTYATREDWRKSMGLN